MQLLYYSIPISLSSAYINFMATSTEDKIIRVSIGGREVRVCNRFSGFLG